MKVILLQLTIISLTLPAYAGNLNGRVQYIEPVLHVQTPKLDLDPMETYKARLAEEVRKRTEARLKVLHMTPQGCLRMHIETSQGELLITDICDHSVNLELVSANVVDGLSHTPIATPPQVKEVTFDLVIETLNDDSVACKAR